MRHEIAWRLTSQTHEVAVPRIVLADNHPEIVDEVSSLLTPEFRILGSVADGRALVDMVRQLKPDVVVSDIRMPLMSGIEAARQILAGRFCDAVVLLTMHQDLQIVAQALHAGVRGYVLKTDAGEDLIPAIRAAQSGETFLSHSLTGPERP